MSKKDNDYIQLEIELSAMENSMNYWYSRCMAAEGKLSAAKVADVPDWPVDEGATD